MPMTDGFIGLLVRRLAGLPRRGEAGDGDHKQARWKFARHQERDLLTKDLVVGTHATLQFQTGRQWRGVDRSP